MACAIDWQLVLEFAKVLAAPLGAIAIAAIGLRTYRVQKSVDRRSEWYQQLHGLLARTADLYRWAGAANADGNALRSKHWMDEALAASLSLSARTGEGYVCGLEDDLVALRRLSLELERCHREVQSLGFVSEGIGKRAADACLVAANTVAAGYRRELRLPAIDGSRVEKRITG